jgi:hypothetical protein
VGSQANNPDDAEDLDSASAATPSESGAESQETDPSSPEASSSSQPSTSKEAPKPAKGALKKYIDSFDKQTVIEMARLVSMEGAALVELQTQALFGDLTALQRQMQVCHNASSKGAREHTHTHTHTHMHAGGDTDFRPQPKFLFFKS